MLAKPHADQSAKILIIRRSPGFTEIDTVFWVGRWALVCSFKMKNRLYRVKTYMQQCTAQQACLQSLIHESLLLNIYMAYNGSGMLTFLSAALGPTGSSKAGTTCRCEMPGNSSRRHKWL